MGLIEGIFNVIRNKVLNSMGVERDLIQLLEDRDISAVKSMLQDRDSEVEEAIREYNPFTHKVMRRPDKPRKGKKPYPTEKLPRGRNRYINEVELYFLLGNDIKWKLENIDGSEEAFSAFNQFLIDTRFNTTMRQAKRLAGAETESAKLYHIFQDEKNNPQVKVVVLARSKGHDLRPLFDQYGNMKAFGHGYYLNEGGNTIEHFDLHTADMIYRCRHLSPGWEVRPIENPTGKINVIYYRQEKAWGDLQPRIDREEHIDSNTADIVNYFANPIAFVSTDIVQSVPDTQNPGNMITGTKDSVFKYIDPPLNSATMAQEKQDIANSILFDSFTPEFTPEKMIGLGTLSGEAIKRAMVLGYIKRDNRKEIYDELVDREKNLVLAIMMNVTHIGMKEELSKLRIIHEFSEPFNEDVTAKWAAVGRAYSDGIMSLEQAVQEISVSDNPQKEIEQIQSESAFRSMANAMEPTF